MRRILFGAVVLAVSLGSVATADEQDDAKAILDEAIKVQGGEAALGKVVGLYFKVRGTAYDEDNQRTRLSFEWFIQGYDKERTVSLDGDNKVTEVEAINGKEGWTKDGDQATEKLSKDQLESRREEIYLNWVTMLVPLKAKGFRLSSLAETSIAGRKAVGILVVQDKHDPVSLYFDKETHLLIEYERKYNNVAVGKVVDEECKYSDYRNVRETKQPFKMEVFWEGKKVYDLRISEMKLHEKPLDDSLFSKP
ncbi:MAG TPA: hypothetical protein VGY55_00080 [Pirellulales bacterium]|jgi:hypothetical protein|nr:hypothetical protein [Pirellulales bacterium]